MFDDHYFIQWTKWFLINKLKPDESFVLTEKTFALNILSNCDIASNSNFIYYSNNEPRNEPIHAEYAFVEKGKYYGHIVVDGR